MKHYQFKTLLLASLVFSGFAVAQNNDVPVRFAKGDFITGNNINRKSFKKTDLQIAQFADTYFSIIQFSELPSLQTRLQLKNAGVELGD